MSKFEKYVNQVLPDDFNQSPTVFKDKEDLLAKLTRAKENNETIYGYCISTHKDTGELELEFMPGEDVFGYVELEEVTYKGSGEENKVHIGRAIDSVDKVVGVKIREIDDSDPSFIRVTCSRKDHVLEMEKKYNEDIEKGLFKENMTVVGRVTGVDSTRVFVDIGADVTAILGVADISRVYIKHPAEKYEVGQKVELAVKKIYSNPIKVSLSRAMMLPGWESIDKRFSTGKIVPGIIKGKIPTGVFVEISESFEGLAEDLPEGKAYNYGDRVKVSILTIDKKREKIKLRVIENN